MTSVLRVLLIVIGAAAFWAASVTPARAQADGARPRVTVTPGSGYARVLFEFSGEARASASMAGEVVVVRFERAVQIDADAIVKRLDGVAAAARLDADGRTLRVALKTPARIVSSSAGRRFALDIVAAGRQGDPAPVTDPEADKFRGPAVVTVRATEMETMTRLTFEWPDATAYDTALKDGRLTIRFRRPGTIDVTRLNARPPTWIKSIATQTEADGVVVTAQVDPAIRLADKAEGNRVMVDLIEPVADAPPQIATAPAAPVSQPSVTADAGPVDPTLSAPSAPQPVAPQPMNTAAGAPKPLVRSDAGAVAAGLPPQSSVPAPTLAPLDSPPDLRASQTPAAAPPLKAGAMTAEMRGDTLLVAASFKTLPKAAIFRRGPAVWVVFETQETLDASALSNLAGTGVSLWSAPQVLQPGVLGLRLRASDTTQVSVQTVDASWVLTFGSTAAPDAGGITFLREVQGPALARLRAIIPGAGDTVWVKDPALGDRLAVTPAAAPIRGVQDARRFPEFDILPSLQGMAVRASTDDLQVSAAGGAATISRPKGLAMSRDAARPEDFAGPAADTQYLHADLDAWRKAGDDPATAARTLLRASADTPGGMSQQRMALARYYAGSDLGAEALGVLRLMATQDPTSETTPAFRTVRAIANLQMRRPAEAVQDLSLGVFARDPHAAFWRGIAFAGLGKMSEARSNLLMAGKFFGAYPPAWQARARIALADASLALGDAKEAERAMAIMPPDLPNSLRAAYLLTRGKVQEALAKDDDALSLYAEAMGAGDPQTGVRAELQALMLKAREKKISPEQAADQLERLRYKWRGDDIELATLRALGHQYVAMGRVREGLDAMQTAVRNFPGAEAARDVNLDMQRAFAGAFLGPKAAETQAVQALALFYDFKQFTPPGLEGDEIIRKLTERLVEVDLLPQAAELLQHQVDNRLDGVARAQVATRLAVIYLLDRKPEKALNAVRLSRQARLPDAMIAERRLVEARALTDLNLTDEAIDTLADDQSPAAGRLRADIFWAGQRWAAAGQASETLAGDSWNAPAALGDTARQDVLRAAVAYVLANDRVGVERLRARFGAKMADSKDARSFAVVVGETNPSSPDMRAMVRQVASADSLDAFLKELKTRKDLSIN